MSHTSRLRRAAVLAPAVALLLAGCAPALNPDDADGLTVVTTTTQLADFATQVGGDDIALTSLLAPGASAHHFDPSPRELVALSKADVLIMNGAELEGFIDSTIEASGFDGLIITAADGIDLAEAKEITAEGEHEAEADAGDADHAGHDHGAEDVDADHNDHDGHDHDHDHGDVNPHLWTSPRYAGDMTQEIARGLSVADPANASAYEERAAEYLAQLDTLDEWVAEQFAMVPDADRVLVSGHDSLRYFLHDYDIAYAGAIMPSFEDNAEPSAAELDALSDKIRERGVKAIFVESSMSPKLAQAIARQAGVSVIDAEALYADSLGPVDSGAETYIGATAHNARVMLEAWGVTPSALPESIGATA